MPKPTALDAYVAATVAYADQLTDLRRMMEAHFDANPDSISWADVGTLESAVADMRHITDRHYRRGEYAAAV